MSFSSISRTAWIFIGVYFFLPRVTLGILYFFATWFQKLSLDVVVVIGGCLFFPYSLICWSTIQAFAPHWNIGFVLLLMACIAIDFAYLLLRDN